MSLNLYNLDERTRELMQEEMAYDVAQNRLHISPYLSGQGVHDYPNLLQEAMEDGDDSTLAEQLRQQRRIARTADRKQPQGGYNIVTIPHNAADMIAENEFNRYYIRALCRRAIEDGISQLIVYRAKTVESPRSRSEALVETAVDPATLLEDLRQHTGEEPELGIPGGPNSGLSVHLP
jgi:DNA repair photolyase